MSEKLKFSFSGTVNGIVWKTLADPEYKRLFLEIRDHDAKRVRFSALDLEQNTWLWKERTFEEPWWISLQSVSGEMLLFTLYNDTNNPDTKSVLAFNIPQQKITWWRNNFTVTAVCDEQVIGVDTKFGSKEISLNLKDGKEMPGKALVLPSEQNFMIIRPFQYQEGNTHFETVKAFLEKKCRISPVISIEYCEYNSLILVSTFVSRNDLANYLFVFNSPGDLVLKETLGEHLKGIALDTFFIFSGYLIFVKNKSELVSYKFL